MNDDLKYVCAMISMRKCFSGLAVESIDLLSPKEFMFLKFFIEYIICLNTLGFE